MLLYMRHGDDRGDDVYRHDRLLSDQGRKAASKKAKKLVGKYGHPDEVFVSPFRRAIETVSCLTEHFTRPVEVHRDHRIAQLLTDKHKRDLKVSPVTLQAITVDEDRLAFHARVAAHALDVRQRADAGAAIWCVTHQVVIEEIAMLFEVEIRADLDFLDHIVVLG